MGSERSVVLEEQEKYGFLEEQLPPPRFLQNGATSLVAKPLTYLKAANTANCFRFRFHNLSDRSVVSFS